MHVARSCPPQLAAVYTRGCSCGGGLPCTKHSILCEKTYWTKIMVMHAPEGYTSLLVHPVHTSHGMAAESAGLSQPCTSITRTHGYRDTFRSSGGMDYSSLESVNTSKWAVLECVLMSKCCVVSNCRPTAEKMMTHKAELRCSKAKHVSMLYSAKFCLCV